MMRKEYRDLIVAAWADAAAAGISVSFDLDNPFVQTVLTRLAKQIRNVAETTKEDIRRLVGQQAENGWSVEELKQRILEKGEIASVSRAETIARTETAAAYSQGSIAAYKASGVVRGLEWLTAEDELTCEICEPLNGKRVDLDNSFADGVDFPPAHPACRCAIAPIVE
jgi:SPP1 gp7 family putative phage head morphogenesis protein